MRARDISQGAGVSHPSVAGWQPMARQDHLVISPVGDEVLVYDRISHHVHRLNTISHAIWSMCDGTRTLPALAQAAGVVLNTDLPLDVVNLALAQLGRAGLLVNDQSPGVSKRQSRRNLVKRAAVAGGISLPTLVSITAPAAAGIGSCRQNGATCAQGSDCCSSYCPVGTCIDDQTRCGKLCGSGCGGICTNCVVSRYGPGNVPIRTCER